jgi:hypothetical protein
MAERAGRRGEITAAEPGRLLRALFGVVAFVGLIGFIVATVIQFATTGSDDWQRRMLENGLLWLVGVQGWVYAGGHLFFADQVADSIGWGRGSPFQFEVGLANLSYGVLGVFASSYGRDWWLATVVAFSVFYLGAAVGHLRHIVVERNFSPGNAGPVLFIDIAVPLFLIWLYVAAT